MTLTPGTALLELHGGPDPIETRDRNIHYYDIRGQLRNPSQSKRPSPTLPTTLISARASSNILRPSLTTA